MPLNPDSAGTAIYSWVWECTLNRAMFKCCLLIDKSNAKNPESPYTLVHVPHLKPMDGHVYVPHHLDSPGKEGPQCSREETPPTLGKGSALASGPFDSLENSFNLAVNE